MHAKPNMLVGAKSKKESRNNFLFNDEEKKDFIIYVKKVLEGIIPFLSPEGWCQKWAAYDIF